MFEEFESKSDVPRNGKFLTSKEIEVLFKEWKLHMQKFPNTTEVDAFKWILMNLGNQWAPIICEKREWHGTVFDLREIDQQGDVPKCPNGHILTRGPGLRLSWSQKDYGSVDDEETNCNVWMRVDFGHGPVEVRCTQVDEHEEHACSVMFMPNEEETVGS